MVGSKLFVILAVMVFLFLSFNTVQAASTKFDRYEWKIRLDTTKQPYACAAAPGGTVTGRHINFYIYTKDQQTKLFNLHIWLGYMPKTLYISELGWCKKIGNTTWKKLFEETRDLLKKKMPTKAIDKLIKSLSSSTVRFFPVMILPSSCQKPKDPYSIIACSMLCSYSSQSSNKNDYCTPSFGDITSGSFTVS